MSPTARPDGEASPRRARLAVLVSGSGRHLRHLGALCAEGSLPATIELVISSRPGVRALEHAEALGLPSCVLPPEAITVALEEARTDFVVMAGYLRRWPLPERWIGRVINIHPSLLPLFGGKGFYGERVHRAALASGMRVSGCTVHFVTPNYDEGPIIEQVAVPIERDDDPQDLADRVFAAERALLPRVVEDLIAGRVRLVEGRVRETR